MTPTKLAVIITLLVLIVGLIIFDIFLATNKVSGDTISEVTAHYAKRSILLPAALGILIGHFLWPSSWLVPGWVTMVVLGGLGATWLGLDLYEVFQGGVMNMKDGIAGILRQYPIIIFAIHVFVGRFFWAQHLST